MVRGPIFTLSTGIRARKRPVATEAPRSRSAVTNAVTSGSAISAGAAADQLGPPPFAGVGVQRELADHQQRDAGLGRGPLVVKDPQLVDLAGHRLHLGGAVAVGDSE